MASKITSMWNDELVEASSYTITAGAIIELLNSGEISNVIGTIYDSLKVTINYDELTPDISGAPFSLGTVVEQKDENGKWHNLAYQFSPHKKVDQGSERIIIMQPDMDTFNLGTDDIVFPIDRTLARVSRQQGVLGASAFRVRILLKDNDPTGPNAFESVKISGEAEQYNHV